MNTDMRLIQLEDGQTITRTEMVDILYDKFVKAPGVLDTLLSMDKYKSFDKWDFRHRVGAGLDVKTIVTNPRGRLHSFKDSDSIDVVFKPDDYSTNGIVIHVPFGDIPVSIEEKELVYSV